jgi:hypothetical protein
VERVNLKKELLSNVDSEVSSTFRRLERTLDGALMRIDLYQEEQLYKNSVEVVEEDRVFKTAPIREVVDLLRSIRQDIQDVKDVIQ